MTGVLRYALLPYPTQAQEALDVPSVSAGRRQVRAPPLVLPPREVAGFTDALQAFQGLFHDCFPRSESRAHFYDYLVGQLSPLARKSIAPMARRVAGASVRGLQRFLSAVPWDDAHLRWTYHQLVAADLGAPEGVLIVDELRFVKKGPDSAGVARQAWGPLGAVAHCQVGVFAGYASRQGYALVDTQLFLPEVWWTDAYAARRARCKVPKELAVQSKPQLAAAMVTALWQERLLPFKYLVAAGLYGQSPTFLDAVDACVGCTTLVAVPPETRCWLQWPPREATHAPAPGAGRAKRGGGASPRAPRTVAAVAASLPASRWYRRQVSDGPQGPSAYECARQWVTLCTDSRPYRSVWLVLTRTVGVEPSYTYAISNASTSIPLSTLIWLSGLRGTVAQWGADGHTALGMDHYEVRQYGGWHHHMWMTMLAHFFLGHWQRQLGETSPSPDGGATPTVPGSGVALADVSEGRGPCGPGLAAAVPSPRLSGPA